LSPVEQLPRGAASGSRNPGRRPSRIVLSTSTVSRDGRLVPWLAAEGPLCYSPESPPERDYYFQYNRVLPGIFAEGVNLRRPYYFGVLGREHAREVLSFWQMAREGTVERVAHSVGTIAEGAVTAALAVYRIAAERIGFRGPRYVFVQHGSFQFVSVDDQPRLESVEVTLYRGVEKAAAFRQFRRGRSGASEADAWRRYLDVQGYVLSDSSRSFNSIHDRAARAETGHLRDRSWLTDAIARQRGFDPEGNAFEQALWASTHQSFALERWVAENKFGPNYVVAKTPLDNIRLTTFFAGEHEVRVIDPDRLEIVERHGCRVDEYGG
jgi:hypothetical protein